MTQRIVKTYLPGDQLSRTVNRLRIELLDAGYAFGALFVAQRQDNKTNFALIFADNMPQSARAELLKDLRATLEESEKRFRI